MFIWTSSLGISLLLDLVETNQCSKVSVATVLITHKRSQIERASGQLYNLQIYIHLIVLGHLQFFLGSPHQLSSGGESTKAIDVFSMRVNLCVRYC